MSQQVEIIKAIPFSPMRAIRLLVALGVYFLIAFGVGPVEGLTHQGQCAIALMVAAVIIWVTDALPLAVAAILMTMIQPLAGASPWAAYLLGAAHGPAVHKVFTQCFSQRSSKAAQFFHQFPGKCFCNIGTEDELEGGFPHCEQWEAKIGGKVFFPQAGFRTLER